MMRVVGFAVALLSAVQATEYQQHAGANSPGSASTGDEHKSAAAPGQLAGASSGGDAGRARSDAVSKAQESARASSQLAASKIAGIKEYVRELEGDLRSGRHAVGMARSIMSNASRELKERRLEAEGAFQTKLHALNATQMQLASGKTVQAAAEAASAAERNLTRAQLALFPIVRASFRTWRRAAFARNTRLWSEARKAAHQARHASDAVSRAMRKAGAREATYERVQGHSEELGDRLLSHAEEAAERVQDLIEDQLGRVETELDRREDVYRNEVESAHAGRRRLLREAEADVARARTAARAAASAHLSRPMHQTKGQSAGTSEGETGGAADPSRVALLAGAPVMDLAAGFSLPAAGGTLLAAAVLAGIVATRTRAVRIGERPSLG